MPIEIKPVSGIEQLERWVAIHNTVRPDDPDSANSRALIRAEETDRVDLLGYLDGEPVAAATLAGTTGDRARTGAYGCVSRCFPDRAGVGSEPHCWTRSRRSRDAAATPRFAATAALTTAIRGHFSSAAASRRSARWDELVLELEEQTPAPPTLPDGIELTTLADRPDLLAGMYSVAATAYPELGVHMARQVESFVGWQAYELGNPANRFELAPNRGDGEERSSALPPCAHSRRTGARSSAWSRWTHVAQPRRRNRPPDCTDHRRAGRRDSDCCAPGFRMTAQPDLYERLGFTPRQRFVEYATTL